MSSTSSRPTEIRLGSAGPLTTIFTPPANCFDGLPTPWPASLCWDGGVGGACFWSLPDSCYPAHAGLGLSTVRDGLIITKNLGYSPGVLPLGFYTAYPSSKNVTWKDGDTTYAVGCRSNFLAGDGGSFCTSLSAPATASIPGQGPVSFITAIMPQIQISWQSSDLTRFTPSSAPALPEIELSAWEASVARQANITNATGSGNTKPASTNTGESARPNERNTGLSTGAKAGIGVGVAAAVLIILVTVLVFMRRSKRRTVIESSKTGPCLDSKAELDNSGRVRYVPAAELSTGEPKELATYERPQELSSKRAPPPIPFASKPR